MSANSIIMMVLMILANWGCAALVISKIIKSQDQEFSIEEEKGTGA